MGAGPELVAAVSSAGGFGVLGGDGRSAEQISTAIERTRELTDRPFGVNFLLAALEDPEWPEEDKAEVRQLVETAMAQRVSAIVLSVVETVRPVPVIASGGIGDGAGIARALEAGAQGVSLGTRFVASDESWIHPAHKQGVVESTAGDTVHSTLYDAWWPGAAHRTLRNKTFDEWEAANRPPPGERPGEGTSIGSRRLLSGEVQDWPRYAAGLIPRTLWATSSGLRCTRGSPAAW